MFVKELHLKGNFMGNKTLHYSCALPTKNISPKTVDEILNMSFGYVIKNLADITSTGAYLYCDALSKYLDAESIMRQSSLNNVNLSDYNTLVVDDIVHISGYYNTLSKYYDVLTKNKNLKVVPMSFGIWHDYELTERDVLILKMMSERAEIGCRNELIADILNKKGIKNIRVIGCPSMFYHMDRNFKITNKNELRKVNFNAYVSPVKFGKATTKFMDYVLREASRYDSVFTLQENVISELFDYLPISDSWFVKMPKYKDKYFQYLKRCGKYFYNVHDWIHGLSDCDFSLARKLHGSIAAILAGVPTFCVAADKLRVAGTYEFYKIPFINYYDFDHDKPIEHYYELADYTEFNKNYATKFDTFVDFCHKNGVALKIDNSKVKKYD